jgi:hypothetical protein
MVRTRTTARALLVVALFGLAAGTAAATPPSPPPPKSKPKPPPPKRKQIVFPVLGTVEFTDDFGAPRPQGPHQGVDILAPRHALALAAEPGRVRFYTGSSRAGCMLYLDARSGTTYLYIHLNNDLTEGNDNSGSCVPGVAYAPGLKNGGKVAAGQPIGYVGDSGDADGINPHLHFEVHPGGGGAVNPFPHLRSARRLLFSARPGSTFTLALTGNVASAFGEDLQLSVQQVRQWPGGRKVKQAGQKVPVVVPETASIEGIPQAQGFAAFPTLDLLTKGMPVTVWTEPAKVTLAAQAGAAGALAAARVVVRP